MKRLLLSVLVFILSSYSVAYEFKTSSSENIKFGGIIMFDASVYDGIYNDAKTASDSELRRARINIKSIKNKRWNSKLDINFNDEENSTDVKSVYIQYRGSRYVDVTMGKLKEPVSLQNSTSSKSLVAMERSLVTEAFSPGRSYGVALSARSKEISWQAGLFKAKENEEGRDTYAVSARLAFTPFYQVGQLLHFGLSGSVRDYDGMEYEMKNSAEVNTANKVLNTSKVNTDTLYLMVLEWAWLAGAYCLQAEWFQQSLDLNDSHTVKKGNSNGFYIQSSYLFSGSIRKYKEARFGRPSINYAKTPWELVARYSELEAKDDYIFVNTALIGVNYYINKQLRLMANFLHTSRDNADNNHGQGNAISFRIQQEF